MRQRCLSAEAIADLIRGITSIDYEHHISQCETCTRRVAFVRRIASAGIGPIVQVADEVEDLIARLTAAPRSTWWRIVREPEFQRPDLARRLLTLGMDARFRDRSRAIDLAKAATTIADAVPKVEVSELRFEAWRFSSAVLREAGRYSEAETAILRAQEAAQATRDPELAQASVLLSRALFYAEPDIWRPEDAATLLDRAQRVFAHRDARRMHAARIVRASLMYRSGDIRAASDAYAALLAATPETDREAYLQALSNLMWVRVELREGGPNIDEAIALLIEESEAAGRAVHVAHAQWLRGKLHAIRGEFDDAVAWLTTAMDKIGDDDACIRIGLDTIESLLHADRYHEAYERARELASVAVALDRREPSRRHNLTSQVVAYLREAARREALTPDLVTECARYLDRITRQPPFEFVPPMPLTEM